MSAQTYKADKKPARHEQVVDQEYEQGVDPDYDDTAQASYEQGADPDYDEGRQREYYSTYADPEGDDGNGSQEWRHRPQK